MNRLNVKIKEHGHQRNGISGESFHYFLISFEDDNLRAREAIVSLTVSCDENGEYPEKFNGSCRVITPDSFSDHWRGDVFEDAIRTKHGEWY